MFSRFSFYGVFKLPRLGETQAGNGAPEYLFRYIGAALIDDKANRTAAGHGDLLVGEFNFCKTLGFVDPDHGGSGLDGELLRLNASLLLETDDFVLYLRGYCLVLPVCCCS